MHLWEVGVFLFGVGFLILAIFLGTTLRDLGTVLKRVNRILTDNQADIQTLIANVTGITSSVNKITTGTQKAVKNITTFGALKSAASGLKKRRTI